MRAMLMYGIGPRRNRGFTTVELLVVLAIVGLTAALAIPVAARMGFFGGRQSEYAARTLFMTLRAAKIYAATYNVETAVAYDTTIKADTVKNKNVTVVRGFIVVRKLTRAELDADNERLRGVIDDEPLAPGRDDESLLFVPVAERGGRFRVFDGEMCILDDIFDAQGPVNAPVSETGLSNVFILGTDFDSLILPPDSRGLPNGFEELWRGSFPAHVFTPSGEIRTESTRQRVVLHVGPFPNVEAADRFVFDSETGEIATDSKGEPLRIETQVILYVAQGRVKVAS